MTSLLLLLVLLVYSVFFSGKCGDFKTCPGQLHGTEFQTLAPASYIVHNFISTRNSVNVLGLLLIYILLYAINYAMRDVRVLCYEGCEGHGSANGLPQPRMELAERSQEQTYLGLMEPSCFNFLVNSSLDNN